MKPIICVGHAALDFVYRIEAFPPVPTKVRSLEHIESGGGMAANAAATIARLGGPVELWSRTGADSAKKFLDSIKIENLKTATTMFGSDLAAVKLTGVSKSFPGVRALSDVSFDCVPGSPLSSSQPTSA